MQPTKLIRAETSDVTVIAFITALEYGQIRQIVNALLNKAVEAITNGSLTKGALIDGRFKISNQS